MKKGPLTKGEKEKILFWKLDAEFSYTVQVIADKLERSVEVVQKYLDTQIPKPTTHEIKEPEVPEGYAGQLLARDEKRGVVMMTPQSSQVSDDKRVKEGNKTFNSQKYTHTLHTIKKETK